MLLLVYSTYACNAPLILQHPCERNNPWHMVGSTKLWRGKVVNRAAFKQAPLVENQNNLFYCTLPKIVSRCPRYSKTIPPGSFSPATVIASMKGEAQTLANCASTQTGETEWTLNGRYTGLTDLPLTSPAGESQVLASSSAFVGPHRLIDPSKLARVLISPRHRAQQTAKLLLGEHTLEQLKGEGKVATSEEIREWQYGRYEGWLTREIKKDRKERGLDQEKEWDVWRDGCEDGEGEGEMAKGE